VLRGFIEESFEAPTPKEAFELAKRIYKDRDFSLVRAKHKIDGSGKMVSEITLRISTKNGDRESSEEIESISKLLTRRGLNRNWVIDRLKRVDDESIFESERSILTYIIEELEKNIYIKRERFYKKKAMVLIGTTGVGKTTTLAKLATRFAYMLDKDYKVAILNLDTYKAGAYEQLKSYANTLLLDYYSISSAKKLEKILTKLVDFDIILADSAGISPKDTDRLIRQIEFLKSMRNRELEVELVIPATFKYDDIVEIYEYFSFLDLSGIIITKLDETNSIGNLITFLTQTSMPVSYLCFGQRIPDDLLVASKGTILDYFVGDNLDAQ
jgi:flagellar biosynthesis protein FlhF